jgi:hypothetical protein
MSYPTINDVSDGQVLTAAHLNLIADAVNYVAAIGGLPNPGIQQWTSTSTSTATAYYWARYTNRYLHVVTNCTSGDDLKVTIDGNATDDNDPGDGYEDHVIDCNGYGLTAGAFYAIKVDIKAQSGGSIGIAYVGFLSTATALV